ncbi:MAG: response regulator [Myxococcaceae bacterium]
MDGPVLLIDDHRETVDVLARLLEARGIPVLAFSEPVTAVKLLHSGLRPCVVVTDQQMPELYGTELIQALRSRPGCEETWVVILSASPLKAARDRFTLFRQKPIDPEDFVFLVERLATQGGCGELADQL